MVVRRAALHVPCAGSAITNTDPNSVNFARTPRQVLNIVYGESGARKGGFFPDGANGGPKFGELLSETGG